MKVMCAVFCLLFNFIFLVNVGNEEDDRERVRKVNKTKQINIQS